MDALSNMEPQVQTMNEKTNSFEVTLGKLRTKLVAFEERFLKLDKVENSTYQAD
jgi:hypothetical protein